MAAANHPNELAPTLEPLIAESGGDAIRAAFDRMAALGFRWVQLSALQPGLRPRELDQSARRDLLAILRRRELSVGGLDAWIPPAHFLDAQHADRAIAAMMNIIELAGDLGRCPVSFSLPAADDATGKSLRDATAALSRHAQRFGVDLADHAVPSSSQEGIGVGIDPAASLSLGKDPIAAATSATNLVSARLCDVLPGGTRAPIGRRDGRLDLVGYKVALSVAGFTRPVVLDARQWSDAWAGLEQSKNEWLKRGS